MMTTKTIQRPKPSKTLERKIDACVVGYKRLGNLFIETLEQGRKEGFRDLEVGSMIKERMLKAGISIDTIRKYLPASAKAKPRANPSKGGLTKAANKKKSLLNGITNQEKQDVSSLAIEMLTAANKEEEEVPLPRKSRFDEMEEEEEREKEQQAQAKGSGVRLDDSEIWECDSWPVESFTMRDVSHYTLTYIKKAHKQIGEVIKELEQGLAMFKEKVK